MTSQKKSKSITHGTYVKWYCPQVTIPEYGIALKNSKKIVDRKIRSDYLSIRPNVNPKRDLICYWFSDKELAWVAIDDTDYRLELATPAEVLLYCETVKGLNDEK
jgi:hypothetical protein